MSKKVSPTVSWNRVVKCLQDTKKAWEVHREIMGGRPNLELLSVEAQKRLKFALHRSSSFEKFLRAAMDLWQLRGGMDAMVIPGGRKKKGETLEEEHLTEQGAIESLLEEVQEKEKE